MPRLFFAVRTPQALVTELEGLQQHLTASLRALRPEPSLREEKFANSHCTIRFLGEVDAERVSSIVRTVRERLSAPSAPKAFDVHLGACGVFSNLRHARVCWASLEPSAPLMELRMRIDAGLAAAGFAQNDAETFHPHLTLLRFRREFRIPPDFAFPVADPSAIGRVQECVLVQSTLGSTGAHHEVLESFSLS